MFVSIDPGKNQAAIAAWGVEKSSQLIVLEYAGRVGGEDVRTTGRASGEIERAQHWANMGDLVAGTVMGWVPTHGPVQVIVEVPEVHQRGSGKGDPNDLIDLAGVVGAIVGGLVASGRKIEIVWSPLPKEWKGQLPKRVTQARVDAALSDLEKSKIEWEGEKHNIYDAIHLGLVYLQRKNLRGK